MRSAWTEALYVADYGQINLALEKGRIRSRQGTGAVWRIVRDDREPAGIRPPASLRVPFYAIQAAVVSGLIAGAVALTVHLIRRLLRR